MTDAERQAFYEALLEGLSSRDSLRVVERKRLRLVLGEESLASPASASGDVEAVVAGMEGLSAGRVVLPGLCKVGADYVLSVRVVRTRSKIIEACRIQTTRSARRFRSGAQDLLKAVVDLHSPAGAATAPAVAPDHASLAEIVAQCRQARADVLFPEFWSRCEKLRRGLSADRSPAGVNSYYLRLLQLSARAAQAPPGMAFVPGGYVTFRTSKGPRKLWVKAFFLDGREVSVGEYARFLARDPAAGRPITRGMDGVDAAELPVTGIPWASADRFARSKGKVLPTWLQWRRVAGGDDGRRYPCGAAASLKACNLSGGSDGYRALAPADRPGEDRCAFGVVGLTGNVREWTATWYRGDMYERCDPGTPADPEEGVLKIVAGGGWRTPRGSALCRKFDKVRPREAFDDVGFRCALPFWPAPMDAIRREADDAKVNMSARGRKENAR